MAHLRDELNGMNPDQSGPLEKIQNGDPRSGMNRDQRSQASEAGGSGGSLQRGPTGTPAGMVRPHRGLAKQHHIARKLPPGVSGETLPTAAFDRAGGGTFTEHTDGSLQDVTVGPTSVSKTTINKDEDLGVTKETRPSEANVPGTEVPSASAT